MQNAQPPEQVQASFDDAVKAGQDRERQKNEGEAYANDVVPKARGMAARLMQESEGYRSRVVEQAQGDAARFRQIVAEYSKVLPKGPICPRLHDGTELCDCLWVEPKLPHVMQE